jgi:hypothetical protein
MLSLFHVLDCTMHNIGQVVSTPHFDGLCGIPDRAVKRRLSTPRLSNMVGVTARLYSTLLDYR